MNAASGSIPGWLVKRLAILFALSVLLVGCQRQTPRATDSRSLQEHADELKKQHQREMQNK
jgi:hypothetical protein